MNINKNNPNISYKVSYIKQEEQENDTLKSEYSVSSIEEPIPVLISYIQDKYGIDTTEELHEYESRINNKDSEK